MSFDAFFRELDGQWKWPDGQRVVLRVIGSAALMMQAAYYRGTKDSDVLETEDFDTQTKERLERVAGKQSAIARKHRLYIDIVAAGLPFLPQRPIWHSLQTLNLDLENFEIMALDVVDVVVSKLKRFSANDRDDIDAMVEKKLVSHNNLISRFESAVDVYAMDARASELPRYLENLHRVERDFFATSESEIELPSWV